jgi:ABC-2 type transport system ATP-binding protein
VGEAVSAVAVEAAGLGKDYRVAAGLRELLRGRLFGETVRALDAVDLRLEAGETLALLGPNGAGKSTLLRLLGGLVVPTRGRATVAGHDAAKGGPALRAAAGYVAGDARSFAWRLSARENLRFFASLHGHAGAAATREVERVLERVGLADRAGARVATLSTGMRQRLALARGLLGAPKVWLLDEPTAGLDPAAAHAVRALVGELAAGGAAVILATHSLDEARQLGRRALWLRDGRVAWQGPAAEVERGLA